MGTEYQVKRGARVAKVEIVSDSGGSAEVRLDGGLRHVRLQPLPDGRTAVSVDGSAPQLLRTRGERGERVVFRGHTEFRLDVQDARSLWLGTGGGSKSGRGGQIKASMPGRVVRVPVAVGDVVPEGGVVVVLEAMKMENEVRAQGGGAVKVVAVQVGQTVETGALLVELEPVS